VSSGRLAALLRREVGALHESKARNVFDVAGLFCVGHWPGQNAVEAIRPNEDKERLKEPAKTMSIQLPAPIALYIRIENSSEPERVLECFAPDATVHDESQTYEGVNAIKNWMLSTNKKYGHTITPLDLAEGDDQTVLKARLAGNFPGSPVTVNFSFVLADGKIHSLKIGA